MPLPLSLPHSIIFQPHTWFLLSSLYDSLLDYLEYRLFFVIPLDLDFRLIHLPAIVPCAILVNILLPIPFLLLLLANTTRNILIRILCFRPWHIPVALPWRYPRMLLSGIWQFARDVYVETARDFMLSIIPTSYRPRGVLSRVFGGMARWAILLLVIMPVLLLGPIARLGLGLAVYLLDNS